jgi:hypothetical protein
VLSICAGQSLPLMHHFRILNGFPMLLMSAIDILSALVYLIFGLNCVLVMQWDSKPGTHCSLPVLCATQ